MFQSSPARGPGATKTPGPAATPKQIVSILTRPVGRVQRRHPSGLVVVVAVSILTRPVGRVQREAGQARTVAHPVSILTRPVGRVQPPRRNPGPAVQRPCFNPHPARGPGATIMRRRRSGSTKSGFQSSPGPWAGCNAIARYRYSQPSASFNPHPARGPGATASVSPSEPPKISSFQSSPGPWAGCNTVSVASPLPTA